MEAQESSKLVDWVSNLTVGDAVNMTLIVAVVVTVLILVARTFRNKPSA